MWQFITKYFKTKPEERSERQSWYYNSFNLDGSPLLNDATRASNFGFVSACIKVISESIGMLPFRVYQRSDTGRILRSDLNLDHILSTQPNPQLSAPVFYEGLIRDLLNFGNVFVWIDKNSRGKVKALSILDPGHIEIRRNETTPDSELFFYYDSILLDSNRVIHIPVNPDRYGIGISPIAQARENIGLTTDAMEFAKAFYKNGGGLKTFLTTSQKLADTTLERLAKNFKGKFSGVENAHTVPILEEGLELKSLISSLQDSLFLDSRKFEEQEIATIFRIPISKLNMLDRSTHNNIEQQQLDFLTDTLMPYLVKIEKAFTFKLFNINEGDLYVKAELRAILRADSQARAVYYKAMFNMGAMSINEVRVLEELNSVDNLDGHYLNAATSLIDEDGNLTVQQNNLQDNLKKIEI